MKPTKLPISNCHASFTKCRLPVDFCIFESGFGDFYTYLGETTQSFYRVDLDQIKYFGKTLDQLLAPAIEQEGGVRNLILIPDQLRCKFCGNIFKADTYASESDELIDAFTL